MSTEGTTQVFLGKWDVKLRRTSNKPRSSLPANVRTISDLLETEKSAKIDALTKLRSRRAYEEEITRNLQELKEKGGAILFADLDGLKGINDKMGHKEGDVVLKKAGRFFISNISLEDSTYRFGGDEIVSVLFGIQEKDLQSKMIDLVAIADRDRKEDPLAPKFSIGYTYIPSGSTDTWVDMLSRADSAMYRAKEISKQFGDGKSHATQWSENLPMIEAKSAVSTPPMGS
jgi:diguanylate cyclase (GGDEF)-like protein